MLNEIIKGVSAKLCAVFGESYKIYQNGAAQGLTRPCFFIAVLNPAITPLIGRRFISRNPLDIQFIPADDTKNTELYAMGWDLMAALEFIQLPDGDTLHGSSLNFKVEEGVLHCFVNYNLSLIKPVEKTAMETLNMDVGTRKG